MTMMRSLARGLAAATVFAVAAPPAHTADRRDGRVAWNDAFTERFARADPSTGAMFRYWLPGGSVENGRLLR